MTHSRDTAPVFFWGLTVQQSKWFRKGDTEFYFNSFHFDFLEINIGDTNTVWWLFTFCQKTNKKHPRLVLNLYDRSQLLNIWSSKSMQSCFSMTCTLNDLQKHCSTHVISFQTDQVSCRVCLPLWLHLHYLIYAFPISEEDTSPWSGQPVWRPGVCCSAAQWSCFNKDGSDHQGPFTSFPSEFLGK